jgi:tRNA(Ile)-lysidine synthetase-like protein
MIKEIYKLLYSEWFEEKNRICWFNSNKINDIYLSNKYFNSNNLLDNIDIIIYNIDSKESGIGAILLYDQISRHHNRISQIDLNYYTTIASHISDYILTKNYKLSAYDICFIYLPYRHLYDLNKFNIIIKDIIRLYIASDNNDDKLIYKKFIIASINKMYKYKNKKTIEEFVLSTPSKLIYNNWNIFEKILYNTPSNFNFNIELNDDIIQSFKKELKYISNENIIVSLSGGVDSNISLLLIKYFNINNNNIIAVHINYNNRPECKSELEFVKTYCNLLNVKLIYRTIDEINRPDCHNNGLRDTYETLTRNIRYDMYKQVCNIFETKSIVMMGHNKDDCFENILTNINLKKNYNNLIGMNRLSEVDNITFWRPLLDIDKKTIIKYAINAQIPFLEDSTPKWSSRGKIRDTIRPALENYDNNIVSSFFELNTIMRNNNNMIDFYVIPNILNKFIYNKHIIEGYFICEEIIIDTNIWCKIFLGEPFYSFLDNNKITYKSINEFIKTLNNIIINFNIMQINAIKKFVLNQILLLICVKQLIIKLKLFLSNIKEERACL